TSDDPTALEPGDALAIDPAQGMLRAREEGPLPLRRVRLLHRVAGIVRGPGSGAVTTTCSAGACPPMPQKSREGTSPRAALEGEPPVSRMVNRPPERHRARSPLRRWV